MNIDNYLKLIVNHPDFSTIMSDKDIKAFNGLVSTIKNHYFLTDGQASFYIGLLEKNKHILSRLFIDFDADLTYPIWSKPFRQIEIIRKMYILNDVITIESNYSNEVKDIMPKLYNNINGVICISPGKTYTATLSEKNIVDLVNKLRPLNFDISEEILNYYETIMSWNVHDVLDKFNIRNITDEETRQLIMSDIGTDTPIDSLIVNDRRLRYQYHNDNGYNIGLSTEQGSLPELIANRHTTKVWIDCNIHSLDDVIATLKELKRFPILVTLGKDTDKNTSAHLYNILTACELNNNNNIGVYFRLKNTEDGKAFNNLVADKKYNNMLDETTQVAVVEAHTIPKFFLTTAWYPMAVISIHDKLRHSKTAIYANQTDLNITYSANAPFIETKPF